jgi:hypothetical protein
LRMLRTHTDFEWILVLPPFREQHDVSTTLTTCQLI